MPEDGSARTPGRLLDKIGKFGRVDSDEALVAACLRGDARAWGALIDRYESFIFSIAMRRGLSRSDAEDTFQNVCVKLYEHLSDIRDVSRLPGWIASVTVRESALLYRRDPVRLFTETEAINDDSESGEDQHASPSAGPEEELLAIERREIVRRMLNELSEECRKLLTMLYITDNPKSYNETAEDLKMPLGSIGPKRARCLARLRSLLESIGY